MNASLVHRRGSEDGIALPMTLIIMCLITALTVAFLAFTSTEPAIASNQMMNAQARAIAESGVERALWALTKGDAAPGTAGSLADPLPAPVPAPYDGSQYVAVGVGGFIVTVGPGGVVNERTITAVGYVPNNVNPIAIKKIQTTVARRRQATRRPSGSAARRRSPPRRRTAPNTAPGSRRRRPPIRRDRSTRTVTRASQGRRAARTRSRTSRRRASPRSCSPTATWSP